MDTKSFIKAKLMDYINLKIIIKITFILFFS